MRLIWLVSDRYYLPLQQYYGFKHNTQTHTHLWSIWSRGRTQQRDHKPNYLEQGSHLIQLVTRFVSKGCL